MSFSRRRLIMKRIGMLAQMLVFCLGGLVLAGLAVAFGFRTVAPFLLFGGCALMMVVMMRGMGGGGHDDHRGSGDDAS
jgi:hypothetical protein